MFGKNWIIKIDYVFNKILEIIDFSNLFYIYCAYPYIYIYIYTTFFTIDNNQYVTMISKGACDTED